MGRLGKGISLGGQMRLRMKLRVKKADFCFSDGAKQNSVRSILFEFYFFAFFVFFPKNEVLRY